MTPCYVYPLGGLRCQQTANAPVCTPHQSQGASGEVASLVKQQHPSFGKAKRGARRERALRRARGHAAAIRSPARQLSRYSCQSSRRAPCSRDVWPRRRHARAVADMRQRSATTPRNTSRFTLAPVERLQRAATSDGLNGHLTISTARMHAVLHSVVLCGRHRLCYIPSDTNGDIMTAGLVSSWLPLLRRYLRLSCAYSTAREQREVRLDPPRRVTSLFPGRRRRHARLPCMAGTVLAFCMDESAKSESIATRGMSFRARPCPRIGWATSPAPGL